MSDDKLKLRANPLQILTDQEGIKQMINELVLEQNNEVMDFRIHEDSPNSYIVNVQFYVFGKLNLEEF